MTRSVSLETASSVALIARQLGAVISNEQIGEEYSSGGCRNEVALTDYFSRYDISVYFKKLRKTDLYLSWQRGYRTVLTAAAPAAGRV